MSVENVNIQEVFMRDFVQSLARVTISLGMIMLVSSAVLAEDTFSCIAEQLPTVWNFEAPPVRIDKHGIQFTDTGLTSVSFYLHNLTGWPLDSLTAIVRYKDDGGQVINEVAVSATTNEGVDHSDQPIPIEGVQHWAKAVAPQDVAVVVGVSNGIRTGICPSEAEITLLRLHFYPDKTLSFSSAGWHLPPKPLAVPSVPDTLGNFHKLPDFIVGQLSIDASGHVLEFVSEDHEEPEVTRWLQEFMRRSWKFYPAILDGHPVPATLPLLVGFPRDRDSLVHEAATTLSPITMIQILRSSDFNPVDESQDKFQAHFGHMANGDSPAYPTLNPTRK
jgi:hypothetical protein